MIILHDKLNTLLGIALLIIVIFKIILKDIDNYFYFDNEIKDILVNISLSYIAAYIFYYIQLRMPEKKRTEQLNEALASPVNRIILNMQSIFTTINESIKFNDKDDQIVEKLENSLKNFDMLCLTKHVDSYILKTDEITYHDHIGYIHYKCIEINERVEQIRKLSNDNIELNILLDLFDNNILFNVNLKLYNLKNSVDFNGGPIYGESYIWLLSEFYELYWKFQYFIEKNKIM